MSIIGRMLNFMLNKVQPTFIAAASADNSSTTVTINKPTGTQDGDLLIAIIGLNATSTVTTLSGWTNRGSFTGTGAPAFYVFTKKASGEGSSYAWTISSGASHGTILTYRGTNIDFDTIGTFSHATSGSRSVSVTTNFAGVTIAAGCQIVTTTPNWNTPSGFNARDDSGSVTWEIGVFDQSTTSSGASGTITLQDSDGASHQMTAVAFSIYSS